MISVVVAIGEKYSKSYWEIVEENLVNLLVKILQPSGELVEKNQKSFCLVEKIFLADV